MDAIDKVVYQGAAAIPPLLVNRYRNDAVFHRLVRMLLSLLTEHHDRAEICAADIREASFVAEELRREIQIQERIQERMREPIEMTIPVPKEGGGFDEA